MTQPGPTEAAELFEEAYRHHMAGELDLAIRLYKRSIAAHPTPEAYTFLGWSYSSLGRVDDAIAQCKRAIGLDPEFGNPYNDIGAYLIQLGRFDEALAWLEQAKRAARYEARHFPYLNVGRVHVARGEVGLALQEFRAALRIRKNDPLAREMVRALKQRLH
jgi:Tfp pilus assembly protein PilF